jgi:hypothetical protein
MNKGNFMKNSLLIMATLLLFSSCAKEEFAINKGNQTSSGEALITTSAKLCAQSTLISPKVDILMLWDNSSSFNFVTPETKASMTSLISSISENFDYHILSLPLIPANDSALYQGVLVAKDTSSVSGNALSILKTKEVASNSLTFTQGVGSAERGIDRATDVIIQNRANGIFRQEAYTIIVIMSNEDDKGCELATGYSQCSAYDKSNYLAPKKTKLLCLRGNTTVNCSGTGVTSLNSTMMRFINISPLTSCASGFNKNNSIYRDVAKTLYETPYSNDWPTSNDHISPDVSDAPDSYNLCSISFSHIFDGVNTAIKQTLLKHKYDYWPVAGSTAVFDPDTIRVVRSDGKILGNRKSDPTLSNGYELITDSSGNPQTVSMNTRYYPTPGEPFTGKMIRLYGADGNDKIVYPDCLTVKLDGVKSTYGYVYLQYGQATVSSIQVYKSVNGGAWTPIPQSSSDGWDYMGLQFTSALDSTLKILSLPGGTPSGYFIRLNGSYKFQNSVTNTTSIRVDYNSQSQQ